MNIMPSINNITDKKVLLRTDFDIPVENGVIMEEFRIDKQRETIDYLIQYSSVVMVAHIKSIDSFSQILGSLEKIIKRKIKLINNLEDLSLVVSSIKKGELYLLDNVRNWPGEKDDDENFAKLLSSGFDLYINNAFAVSHRKHASVSAITKFLPSYSGFILESEIGQLDNIMNAPSDGKIFIMGGAKAKTKIPVIKNILNKSEKILLGGVIVNDFLKVKGEDVGNAVVDEDLDPIFEGLNLNDPRLIMPLDLNRFENKIPDIGSLAIGQYRDIILKAKLIVWNGPMGIFEDERFSAGTNGVAEAIVNSKAFKVLGGGDTISAVDKLGLLDKFDYVSTGGGAMLSFLAGEKLPGLEALGYYK